jgi:hypothetical protein
LTKGPSDADEIKGAVDHRERDVLRTDPDSGCAEKSFAFLNGFPAFIERGEIPATALRTDDPEASLLRVERESPSCAAALDQIVPA